LSRGTPLRGSASKLQSLQELPGWQRTGDVIAKTFVHDDFRSAIRFVNRVADAAEAANYHPDIRAGGTGSTARVQPARRCAAELPAGPPGWWHLFRCDVV
jgi:hypothetical protein